MTRQQRLGVLMRDGFACVWCDAAVEDATRLYIRRAQICGALEPTNAITECHECAQHRKRNTMQRMARTTSKQKGGTYTDRAHEIMQHINRTRKRKLPPTRTVTKKRSTR